jgi:hypothetical protein
VIERRLGEGAPQILELLDPGGAAGAGLQMPLDREATDQIQLAVREGVEQV